jgi:hypothetical protein
MENAIAAHIRRFSPFQQRVESKSIETADFQQRNYILEASLADKLLFYLLNLPCRKYALLKQGDKDAKGHSFLTHNWGSGGLNHKKVSRINKELKELGLQTWFDEEKLTGNIRQGLADAISNSNCFVVFITKEYELKVNSNNPEDSCYYEFNFASSTGTLTSKKWLLLF